MSHYIVGIDLGTTHTVVAYSPVAAEAGDIGVFHIPQLVAPGEVAALPLLPSMRYHAAEGELAASALQLPWPEDAAPAGQPPVVIGELARRLGAQVPGRLVASAKSWLSHAAVDRLAPILPWGAPAEVPKVSPVEASASYLRHVRSAWNAHFPDSPLEHQELRLTVPASFDEGARALTLDAACQAGLGQVRLLEEPQAAFHDWLLRHRGRLAEALGSTRRVLVCDVGGGTTDLSLIDVDMPADGGPPRLTRVGVGNHLMLGGDNMDLALAHSVEARLGDPLGAPGAPLSAARLAQLMDRCRVAKELLLADDAPEQVAITLLGGGARLVGGSRSVMLQREDVERLVVDGFFPPVALDAQPLQARGGIVAFGLPYARDAAITRHIAAFLRQHGPALPDALLLNGGVFRAGALARRLAETLGAWRGAPLRLLHNDNPDVAVARGAVAHALGQRGLAPRIGGGSARSYFLRLDEGQNGKQAGKASVICILPRGSEFGHEALLEGRTFALRVGQPVRFQLFSAVAEGAGQAPPQAGEVVTLDEESLVRLPPLVMVLQAEADAAASGRPAPVRQDIAVQLAVSLTEVGTLELHCVRLSDPRQRWRLAFALRQPQESATHPAPDEEPRQAARLAEAIGLIDRIFGTNKQQVAPKEVTQLRAQLERLLGERTQWTTPVLRRLFDALWQRERGRRRSAAHERVWLNLAGYGLRPGFGDPLDGWRVAQLWTLFPLGVQHAQDRQVSAEWWTLWRRVAGGLDVAGQLRLLDDFAFNLHLSEKGEDGLESGARPVGGSAGDMLRLGASLERIPAAYKAEIGQWLLGRIDASSAAAARSGQRAGRDASADDTLVLWALGRIGAREPFYGSPHDVVAADTTSAWTEALLALDWKRHEAAAFAAVHLVRVTDDRARDVSPALRERVQARLRAVHAPASWQAMVAHKVELDEATERRMLGESLPPGLRLMA